MFDFFASLFGSGFLLSKYMSDKHQTNVYKKKINNAEEINKMLNASLEQEETLKDMGQCYCGRYPLYRNE